MSIRLKQSLFSIISISFLLLVCFWFLTPHAQAMTPVQDVLKPGNTEGDTVRTVWNALLAFANSLLVIVLLVIAFSNILHIQLDTYALKKSLPTLIIGIVLANFSYFICRAIIDITNMLLSYLVQTAHQGAGSMVNTMGGMDENGASSWKSVDINVGPPKPGTDPAFWTNSFAYLFGQIARIIGAVFVAALGYLMFIRNWVIYFLVALSPLGFVAMSIPQGKTVFQSWWKNFSQWAFMPIVSYFWIWVGAAFLSSNLAKTASGTGGTSVTMIWAFAIACYYFALTTPFKMGGAIMKAWGGFGQKVVSGVGGFAKSRWVDPVIEANKNKLQAWYQRTGSRKTGFIGRTVGWQARLARGSKLMRDRYKESVETSSNQLDREALGGKYGQFGTYANNRRLRRYTDTMMNNRSELGESEWVHKELETQFHRKGVEWEQNRAELKKQGVSDEEIERLDKQGKIGGIRANWVDMARSKQFADRLSATESEEKVYRQYVAALSNLFVPGHHNPVLEVLDEEYQKQQKRSGASDTSGYHFRDMALLRKKWEAALAISTRMDNKRLGDTANLNIMATYPMHAILSARDEVLDKLTQIDELAASGAITPAQAEESKGVMNAHLEKLRESFGKQVDQTVKSFWDADREEWRTDAGAVKDMLGEKREIANFDQARSLHSVYGVPEHLQELYDTRNRKEYSQIAVKEKAASEGKRESVEAMKKFQDILKELTNAFYNGRMVDISGDLLRQGWGEYANAITKAGQIGSGVYASVYQKEHDLMKQAGIAGGDFEYGAKARGDLATRIAAAAQAGANKEENRKEGERVVTGRGIATTDPRFAAEVAKEAMKASFAHYNVSSEHLNKMTQMLNFDIDDKNQISIGKRDWGGDEDWQGFTNTAADVNNIVLSKGNLRDRNLSDVLRGLERGIKETFIIGKEAGNYITNETNVPGLPEFVKDLIRERPSVPD